MKTIPISPEEFLRAFFAPEDRICLRVFADRKDGILFKGMKLETTLNTFAQMMPRLQEQNAMNRGIFFVVNSGGHEDKQIAHINAQFMECDDLPLEEQWQRIRGFPLQPSIVVKTRKSLHTYWLMRDANVTAFRRIQQKLVKHFDADSACVNESRVMRLPGFLHCKEEPIMVECVKFDPQLRYTQAQLEALLPASEESIEAPLCKPAQKGLFPVLEQCDFMQHCKTNAAKLAEHDWYAMISNLSSFEGGREAIHRLSAAYPQYSETETDAKIAHFLSSGTGPITCKVIAEKGFRCLRFLDGSCPCKAPAAMAYQQPDVDVLRRAMNAIHTANRKYEDSLAAQQFVERYMAIRRKRDSNNYNSSAACG